MTRNNVTRLLEAHHVPYTAFELTREKRSAVETARMLGVPPELVFKTIVVLREKRGKAILCLVPASAEVNLKKLAKELGEKKLVLPSQREAEDLTGLQAGGISPLALLNKGFQMCIDKRALARQEIHISGGQRELNIRLGVSDLVALINASWVVATDDVEPV
jgi:Cys-tRNA(Pro)/Cys-tRNA(Cys) deacylase